MRKKALAIALCWCAGTTAALAVELPKAGHEDSRVRYAVYQSGNVVRIAAPIGAALSIEFDKNERIVAFPMGAIDAVNLIPAGNFLYVRAMKPVAQQALFVLVREPDGALRQYQFEFHTLPKADEASIYALKFVYPKEEREARAKVARIAAEKQSEKDALADLAETQDEMATCHFSYQRNFHYVEKGDQALKPECVWDNGTSTVFNLGGMRRMPTVFEQMPDGRPEAVNETIRGQSIIVAGTAPVWWLRDGDAVMEIFNRAYSPHGPLLPTHTISPSVQRVLMPNVEGDNG